MDTKPCRACTQAIPARATKCPHCLSRQQTSLNRGAPGKLLGGVCAALAEYLGVELALVRVAFVLGTVLSGGLVFSGYLALWILTPPSADGVAPAYRLMDWLSDLVSPKAPRAPTGPIP